MPEAIYTAENTKPAYQLDWSYSLFWHSPPQNADWFDQLQPLTEPDGVRLLQHEFAQPHVSQFLISTQPQVTPQTLVQRVKGRLQNLLGGAKPFRRNYSLRSIGSTRREKLEQYLANQLDHHPLADPVVADRFRQFQIYQPDVDLSQAQRTAHALYWYNLHVVLVSDWRGAEFRSSVAQKIHDTILAASAVKQHRLSRAAILPDHIHLALGCNLEESPQQVALAYMNNLAYVCGMKRVFKFSFYAGTFSEYDLGVIPRADTRLAGTRR